MKKLLIYAHYNINNKVNSYVINVLNSFLALDYKVILATTSEIPIKVERRLKEKGVSILNVANVGYDFFAWKTAITLPDLNIEQFDRLVLLNSSAVGPFFSVKNFLNIIEQKNADVIGAIISLEKIKHIQSYFFYFKKRAITSDAFRNYWLNLVSYKNWEDNINKHEMKMTSYFTEHNLTVDAYFTGIDNMNPSFFYPNLLYKSKLPFIKVAKIPKKKNIFLFSKLIYRYLIMQFMIKKEI